MNLTWGGTATFGADYSGVAGHGLTLLRTTSQAHAGATTATITVTPVDDAAVEVSETVTLTIATGTGYTVGTPSSATGSIADNDVAPLTVSDFTVTEANNQTTTISIPITRCGPTTNERDVHDHDGRRDGGGGHGLPGEDVDAHDRRRRHAGHLHGGDRQRQGRGADRDVHRHDHERRVRAGRQVHGHRDDPRQRRRPHRVRRSRLGPRSRPLRPSQIAAALDGRTGESGPERASTRVLSRESRSGWSTCRTPSSHVADGNEIRLDVDAAGWGWTATGGRIDLTYRARHELGHLLGLNHDDADLHPIMAATLAVNARRRRRATTAQELLYAATGSLGAGQPHP